MPSIHPPRGSLAIVVTASAALLAGCQLFWPVDDYASGAGAAGASIEAGAGGNAGGDAGAPVCGEGLKLCSGACEKADPEHGCDEVSCAPIDPSTDGEHCGACGHTCNGDPCVAGACTVTDIAKGQAGPNQVAVDSTHAYWTNGGDGTVMRAQKKGGTPQKIASGQTAPDFITVDASHVYWTNNVDNVGAVMRVAKDGSAAPQVLRSGADAPNAIAVDATGLFWVEYASGEVWGAVAGGSPKKLSTTAASSLFGIALDADWVYCTEHADGGRVLRMAKAGGALEAVASAQPSPAGIARLGASLFWVTTFGPEVMRLDPGGEPVVITIEPEGQIGATMIAVDGEGAFWSQAHKKTAIEGWVKRVDPDGGEPVQLTPRLVEPRGLAVDSTHVYFTDVAAGRVARVSKGR